MGRKISRAFAEALFREDKLLLLMLVQSLYKRAIGYPVEVEEVSGNVDKRLELVKYKKYSIGRLCTG